MKAIFALAVGFGLAMPLVASAATDAGKKHPAPVDKGAAEQERKEEYSQAAEKANRDSANSFGQNFLRAGVSISTPAGSNGHQVDLMQGFAATSNTFGISSPTQAPHPRTAGKRAIMKREYRSLDGMSEQTVQRQEDMPEVYYQSCVRMKMNIGLTIAGAIHKCDDLLHMNHSDVLHSPPAPAPAAPESKEPDPAHQAAKEEVLAPLGSDDMSCDVSRDYRILLSDRCLKNADASLYEHMGARTVYRAPSGTMVQRMDADRPSGGVRCDYSIFSLRPGLGSVTKSYHESTLKSCISRAVSDGGMDTHISIMAQIKGRISEASCIKRQTGVSCHQVR